MTWKTAIESEMKKAGLSKAKLSRESGVTKSYITELLHKDESKRKTNPSFHNVEKIAKAFKLKGWQLWKRAGELSEG